MSGLGTKLVGRRVRCPLCKQIDIEIVAAPQYAAGAKLADHQMHALMIWYKCPLSSSPVEEHECHRCGRTYESDDELGPDGYCARCLPAEDLH